MGEDRPVAVKVWDMPVRLFHWIVVVLLLVQFVTAYIGGPIMSWHVYSGYCLLVLIVFRILWGFVGSTHAQFASFIAGPGATWRFAKRLFSRQAVPQLGHNPLGGWSVLAMLVLLAVQAASGLFAHDGVATEGPFAQLVSIEASNVFREVHRWNFIALTILSGLHVAAVLFHVIVKRDELVRPMFTGVKHVPAALLRERREARRGSPLRRAASREPSARQFPGWQRFAIVFGAAVALVTVVLNAAG